MTFKTMTTGLSKQKRGLRLGKSGTGVSSLQWEVHAGPLVHRTREPVIPWRVQQGVTTQHWNWNALCFLPGPGHGSLAVSTWISLTAEGGNAQGLHTVPLIHAQHGQLLATPALVLSFPSLTGFLSRVSWAFPHLSFWVLPAAPPPCSRIWSLCPFSASVSWPLKAFPKTSACQWPHQG